MRADRWCTGVAFASWDRFPGRRWNGEPIPELVPDLAVEVLSEYFSAGVRLVWLVDRKSRTVTVHTAADDCVTLYEQDVLSGGTVLPEFSLSLHELFAELDRHG